MGSLHSQIYKQARVMDAWEIFGEQDNVKMTDKGRRHMRLKLRQD